MTLVEFLRDRLAEIEAVASAVPTNRRHFTIDAGTLYAHAPDLNNPDRCERCMGIPGLCEDVEVAELAHPGGFHAGDPTVFGPVLALASPARVLADIAAKRAIVDEYEAEERSADARRRYADHPGYAGPILLRCVLALVQPYADHPAFDPAWKL